MNKVTAYGKFKTKGEDTYRTSTYLQWGTSEKIIGACVMCNPGAAKEKEDIAIDSEETQELTLDQTMKKLRDLLEKAYGGQISEGRFYIYNLFTLRNPKMEDALTRFNQLEDNDIMYEDYEDFRKNKDNIPWILIAWGCGETKKIKEQKKKWKDFIENADKEKKIKYIGKLGKKELDFWHPNQRISNNQQIYNEDVIQEYKEKIL